MINKVLLCIALSNLSNTSMKMSTEGIRTACSQAEHLIETAEAVDVSPFILSAMIWHESRWLPSVVSQVKACGLTQVLEKYSSYTCAQLKNPHTSITEGTAVLFFWYEKKGDIYTALKCYNSGYACSSTSYAKIVLAKSKLLMKEYHQLQKQIGEKNE
jgi:soluble lytic murein transglycosylase-like protein